MIGCRLVTFSKCRSIIYKQISELSTLCSAEIGFICFSSAGKPFSFRDPSIEYISNRFLNQNQPLNDNTHSLVLSKDKNQSASPYYNKVLIQLDGSKEKENELARQTSWRTTHGWQEAPPVELNLRELEEQYSRFVEILNNLYINTSEKSVAVTPSMLAPKDLLSSPVHLLPMRMRMYLMHFVQATAVVASTFEQLILSLIIVKSTLSVVIYRVFFCQACDSLDPPRHVAKPSL